MSASDVSNVLQLDGVSAVVELAAAYLVGLGEGDFTVEAWVCADACDGEYLPILGTDEAAPQVGLHLAIKNRLPYMGFYSSDTEGRSELVAGVWYHLAWRYTAASGEQAIFLNGVLDASAPDKAPFLGFGETVRIGRYAVDHHFPGRIAELRIWRLARTAEEIHGHMHQRLRGDEPYLVAYWPLDDGEGELAANRRATLSGENHDATTATLVRTVPDGGVAEPPSRVRFDGESSYVDVASHPDLEVTQYTWEAWLRPQAPPVGEWATLAGRRPRQVMEFDGGWVEVPYYRSLAIAFDTTEFTVSCYLRVTGGFGTLADAVSFCEYESKTGFYVQAYSQERARFTVGGLDVYTNFKTSKSAAGGVLPLNVWTHVAATYGRWKLTLYVDGAQVAQERPVEYQVNTSNSLLIGAGRIYFERISSRFPGQIAEVSVWDRVLDESEIQDIGKRRLREYESGLLAYWPLDAIEVRTVRDASGNQHDGKTYHEVSMVDVDPPAGFDDGPALLQLSQDGALRHRFATADDVAGPDDTAAGSIPWNVWSHVAVTNDGTTARTLINGQVRSESPVDSLAAAGELRFGQGLDGEMAEVRLWNVARTADEIAAGKDLRPAADAAGLVADWPLDEASGSVVLNRVSGGPDGTLTGGERVAQLDVPFPGGQALELDGIGSHLSIPHAPEIHLGEPDQPFTLEVWVQAVAGVGDEQVIVEKGSELGVFPYALRYQPAGGHFVLVRAPGGGEASVSVVSAESFQDGAFHHLAAVRDGTTLHLYVDGVSQGQATDTSGPIPGETPLHVGSRGGESAFFEGALTELRLWRRARTAEEIAAGRWQRLTGDEIDLAGYWPLSAAGAVVADGRWRPSGVGAGAGWVEAPELPLQDLFDAAFDTAPAAAFDGLASAVTVPGTPALMPSATITVEAWVRPEAADGDQAFAGPVASCGDAVSGWGLRATDAECGFLVTVAGRQHHVRWTSTAGSGRWLHLAGVYDGAAVQLWVDGVAVPAARETVTGAITAYGGNLVIGGHPFWTSRHFRGQIAEVRVWSSARTAAEIQQNLFRRLTGDEPALVGYWPLDDSVGNGTATAVTWVESDLPPRVAPAPTPEPDSPDRIAALQARLEELTDQLAGVETLNNQYDMQRAELARRLDGRPEEIDGERVIFGAPYNSQIAYLDEKIAGVGTRETALEDAGVETFLGDLIIDTYKKMEAANRELGSNGSRRPEKIDLALKYVAAAGGVGALFPAPGTSVDPMRITSLRIELEPKKPPEGAASGIAVPSLVDLTPALAERRAAASGLVAEFHSHMVRTAPGESDPRGRVVHQLPQPGSTASPGSTVRLFLGKES